MDSLDSNTKMIPGKVYHISKEAKEDYDKFNKEAENYIMWGKIPFEIKECQKSGYRARTIDNVIDSDVTIAIAENFYTAGEILTHNECIRQKKLYISVLYSWHMQAAEIVSHLNNLAQEEIIINIAGNGVYGLHDNQEEVDLSVFTLLLKVTRHPNLIKKIKYIRSGGQSGIDEAGVKAALKLSIPAFILAPKGYLYMDKNKNTITGKEAFSKRFYE